MVTHYDLAKDFIEGVRNEKGSRMFIEEGVIYSYGHHFPIAKSIGNNKYLFNTNKYSSSTSKHQGYVRAVLYSINAEVFECSTEEIKRAVRNDGDPVVITNTVEHTTIEECFNNLKEVMNKEGYSRVPIKKWKQVVDDWKLLRSI